MRKPIRALLLSAGYGTRLKPITNDTPKCLVKVKGEPILEKWLQKLERINCESVIVNTHYLHDKVKDYLSKRTESNLNIVVYHEKELKGTCGTLVNNLPFFYNSTSLIIHCDNYTDVDLKYFLDDFEKNKSDIIMSMLTFNTDSPSSCGIVETDKENILRGFHEKVENPPGDRANGAIYAFEKNLISFLKKNKDIKDISKDLIPMLIGKIKTWHTNEFFIDIGNIDSLNKANST